MIVLRSILYNLLFYLNLVVLLLVAFVAMLLPKIAVIRMSQAWGRTSVWLLRVVCGTKVEFRGLERLPKGPLIIAAKHQSTWETFALLRLFDDFTFVVKRELMWIPIFGWCMWRARMIPVDRSAGTQALNDMLARAKQEVQSGRQLVIFPEGTRRAPGAPPDYKTGFAQIYSSCGVPCLPIALNSGLFWPRRTFMRYPGTLVVEFLDPLPAGLPKDEYLSRVQTAIEEATSRLVEAGRKEQEQLIGSAPSYAPTGS